MADPVSVDGRLVVEERMGYPSLESCTFTWLVDTDRRRFRRIPRGVAPELSGGPDEWTPYHRLEIDHDRRCFLVVLDRRGTLTLRAWLHDDTCERCRPVVAEPTTLDALKDLLTRWKPRTTQDMPNPPGRPVRPFGGRREAWPGPAPV